MFHKKRDNVVTVSEEISESKMRTINYVPSNTFLEKCKRFLRRKVYHEGWELEGAIKMGCRLLIFPFRVSRGLMGFTLCQGSRIRKITSGLLHLLVLTLVGTALYYGAFVAPVQPDYIFSLVIDMAKFFSIYTAVYKSWFRRKEFQNLFTALGFNVVQYPPAILAVILNGTACLTFMVYPIMKLMYPPGITVHALRNVFMGCAGNTNPQKGSFVPLYPWYELFIAACHAPVKKTMLPLILVAYFLLQTVLGITYIMVLSGASFCYRKSQDLLKLSKALAGDVTLVDEYKRVKHLISLVNKIISPFSLMIVVECVLKTSCVVSGVLNFHPFVRPVYFGCFFYNCTGLFLAAESNRLMGKLEKRVINSNPDQRNNMAIILANLPGETGLTGWNFFTISYGLLGSALTAAFTYGLVAIQFAVPPAGTRQ